MSPSLTARLIVWGAARSKLKRPLPLNVESEMHDIALADDVLLAFEPELARLLRARLALVGDIVVVGDDFRAYEAMLEVGVDHARRLRGGRALAHGPRAHFLGPRGEIGLQPEQRVARADHAVQSWFVELELLQEISAIRLLELRDLGLDRRAHRYHHRAFGLGDLAHPVETRIARKARLVDVRDVHHRLLGKQVQVAQ